MVRGKRLIGIEVTDHQLKMAEIVKNKKQTVLTNFAIEAIPAGVIQNGVIQSKDELHHLLKKIKRQHKLRGRVNLAINSANILLRPLQMQKLDKKQLHKAIEMEITNNIQLPFQGYTYDYAWIPEAGADVLREMGMTDQEKEHKHEMMLLIASKEMLDTYVTVLKKVGLEVVSVDLAPLSLLRILENEREGQINPLFVGVNLYEQFAEVSVFSDGVIRLSRNIMLNPQNYLTETEAEDIATTSINIAAYTADLMREVERILNFYRYTLNHRDQMLHEIVLAGDLPIEAELLENAFASYFQASASNLVAKHVHVHTKIEDTYPSQAHKLTVAVGLALKDVRA